MNLEAFKILMEGMTPDGVDCTTMGVPYGNGNAIEWETGIFLYGLVRRYQPKRILETGSHMGLSSACMALALKDNVALYPNREPGKLTTIDASSYDGKPEQLWARIGVLDVIDHIIGNSEDPATYTFSADTKFDFAWYDADHDSAAIIRELKASEGFLNRKRCILGWHDTVLDARMRAGVDEIANRVGLWNSPSSLVRFTNMRGLDLIVVGG